MSKKPKKDKGTKELKRLGRSQLLELMLQQAQEVESLRTKLSEDEEKLKNSRPDNGEVAELRARLAASEEERRNSPDYSTEVAELRARLAASEEALRNRPTDSAEVAELRAKLAEKDRQLQLRPADSAEVAELRARLAASEAKLQERNQGLVDAGSLADAAVQVSGILNAAQMAADEYLENVRCIKVDRDKVLAEAKETANQIVQDAVRRAGGIIQSAQDQARNMQNESVAYWMSISQQLRRFYGDSAAEEDPVAEIVANGHFTEVNQPFSERGPGE